MAKRGRRRADEGEGRKGNGQNGVVPQQSGHPSPTNPRHQVFSGEPVDSPSFASRYPSRHAQAVPRACATLRTAKRVKEMENPNDTMAAQNVDRTIPAAKDVTNSEKSSSRLPPRNQGSEDHHSATTPSVLLDTVIDNLLISVFSQFQTNIRAASSRYPFRNTRIVSQNHAIPRTEKSDNVLAETVDRTIPATEDVPNTEKSTLNLLPQSQRSEKHQLAPAPMAPASALVNNFSPTDLALLAYNTNASGQTPLREATVASNNIEDKLEENAFNPTQTDKHLSWSISVNLSEMAELWDDGSSSQNEAEFPNVALVTVDGYRVKEEVAPILRSILLNHGDIAANCSLQAMKSRSYMLELVCGIAQKLQASEFAHITPTEINSMLTIVGDVECVRLNVGWLRQRLEDISEAKQLIKQSSTWKESRAKNKNVIQETEKELGELEKEWEELSTKVRLTKEKLAEMKAETNTLNETFLRAKTKVRCFYGQSMVEGIL